MLTLVSRRFLVLDEVSFCTRTLPNRLRKGVTITVYTRVQVDSSISRIEI